MATIPRELRDAETACLNIRVPLELKEQLNEIAHQESEPTARVTMSDVARDILANGAEDYTDSDGDGEEDQ
jgi:predicted DNA-binding protein